MNDYRQLSFIAYHKYSKFIKIHYIIKYNDSVYTLTNLEKERYYQED